MKTHIFPGSIWAAAALAGLMVFSADAVAQDSTTAASPNTSQATASSQAVPKLSYGVTGILQLSQARVDDSTSIAYIQNSGNRYGLDAAQIIYLKQQGVSEAVIKAMLDQNSRTALVSPTQAAGAPQPAYPVAAAPQAPQPVSQPAATYVEPAPASTVYVIPSTPVYGYSTYYYQPWYPYDYSWPYPGLSFSFGFGGYHRGGFVHRGGGGFRGGGWHR
jgi:hypothetical protein